MTGCSCVGRGCRAALEEKWRLMDVGDEESAHLKTVLPFSAPHYPGRHLSVIRPPVPFAAPLPTHCFVPLGPERSPSLSAHLFLEKALLNTSPKLVRSTLVLPSKLKISLKTQCHAYFDSGTLRRPGMSRKPSRGEQRCHSTLALMRADRLLQTPRDTPRRVIQPLLAAPPPPVSSNQPGRHTQVGLNPVVADTAEGPEEQHTAHFMNKPSAACSRLHC